MAAVNVFAADTDAEAARLFTSAQQRSLGIIRNDRGLLPPPVETMDDLWSPHEKIQVGRMLACSIVGSRETVRRGMEQFMPGPAPTKSSSLRRSTITPRVFAPMKSSTR